MEYFKFYLDAFKNFRDYHNPAPRKEFNFFILFFFIFSLIMCASMMVISIFYLVTAIENGISEFFKLIILWTIIGLVFYLVHAVPLFALIKRRLIDIIPSKANLIFWIFLTVEIIRILISLAMPFLVYSIQNTIMTSNNLPVMNFVSIWFLGLISNVFAMLMFLFYIFLMVKQGNIGRE